MSTGATVAALLEEARAAGVERLDAQHLLAHHLQQTRAWLLAHGSGEISAEHASICRAGIEQCAAAVPLAYVLGSQGFYGLTLHVTPAVLVPRPDTETLVDWALELLAGPLAAEPAPQVLDLGTGSGAIALAIKHRCPRASVAALDSSSAALAVARGNGQRLALSVEFLHSDWFAALGERRFHLVLANPPYIDAADPHLAALQHEPLAALSPGADGTAALAHLAGAAPQHLHRGGWLLLEHGPTQASAVARLLTGHGFGAITTRADLAARPRCTGGRWPSPAAGSGRRQDAVAAKDRDTFPLLRGAGTAVWAQYAGADRSACPRRFACSL